MFIKIINVYIYFKSRISYPQKKRTFTDEGKLSNEKETGKELL